MPLTVLGNIRNNMKNCDEYKYKIDYKNVFLKKIKNEK